ncbi:MAG: hypothetical protein PHO27_06990 [Sulfuricurvum sp.]|nr:hypothetical protein [Sulfuricurvum sp.]
MKNINTYSIEKTYSVCTLVTNFNEYQEMIASFKEAGFTEKNSDFFYIDNSDINNDDGFSGLNKFLNRSTASYIIICHQDILLKYDNIDILNQRIAEMDVIDSNWAVLGNAGFAGFTEKYYRISDPWGDNTKIGQLPAKVKSLDENFLLIKNDANLALSHNLKGFHMYGADLCTIASFLGWNAYVIDFHLYHKSGGNCNQSFALSRKHFIKKYTDILASLYIRTSCTTLIITNSPICNWIINRKIFYSAKKRLENIQSKLKRLK